MTREALSVFVCMLAAATLAHGDNYQVETLTAEHVGELVALDRSMLVTRTPEGLVETALDELLELRRTTGATPLRLAATGQVELIDGSVFPFTTWRQSTGSLRFDWPGENSDSPLASLRVRAEAIMCWRAMPISAESEEQEWQAIRRSPTTSDRLVVRRSQGDPLDYVEGAILEVDSEGVRFELDQREVTVGWDRVFGLVFARTAATGPGPQVLVHGAGGLRLGADRLESEGPLLRADAFAYESTALDPAVIQRIDFSHGKRRYLSELEQLSVHWTPAEPTPSFPDLGLPRRDADFSGKPISLRFVDPRLEGAWRLREFSHGLAVRSRTELTLALPSGMNRLTAWVGVDPDSRHAGAARITLLADDVPLARFDVSGEDEPYRVDEPITGARRLTIEVDYGDNFDTGDLIHFADACVTK